MAIGMRPSMSIIHSTMPPTCKKLQFGKGSPILLLQTDTELNQVIASTNPRTSESLVSNITANDENLCLSISAELKQAPSNPQTGNLQVVNVEQASTNSRTQLEMAGLPG